MKNRKTLASSTSLAALLTVTIFASSSDTLWAQEIGSSVAVQVSRGDANGDGMISYADTRVMLHAALGLTALPASIRDLDVNRDGEFNLRDVSALHDQLGDQGDAPERVSPTIERAILGDVNDDGHVTPEDIFLLAYRLADRERVPAPDEAVDLNRDGRIDDNDLVILLLWELRDGRPGKAR